MKMPEKSWKGHIAIGYAPPLHFILYLNTKCLRFFCSMNPFMLKGKQPDLFILWNVQLCKSNWTSIYMQSKLFINFCVPPQFCPAMIVHSFNLMRGGAFICLPLALALALPKLFCPGIGLNLAIKKWVNRGGQSTHEDTFSLIYVLPPGGIVYKWKFDNFVFVWGKTKSDTINRNIFAWSLALAWTMLYMSDVCAYLWFLTYFCIFLQKGTYTAFSSDPAIFANDVWLCIYVNKVV